MLLMYFAGLNGLIKIQSTHQKYTICFQKWSTQNVKSTINEVNNKKQFEWAKNNNKKKKYENPTATTTTNNNKHNNNQKYFFALKSAYI